MPIAELSGLDHRDNELGGHSLAGPGSQRQCRVASDQAPRAEVGLGRSPFLDVVVVPTLDLRSRCAHKLDGTRSDGSGLISAQRKLRNSPLAGRLPVCRYPALWGRSTGAGLGAFCDMRLLATMSTRSPNRSRLGLRSGSHHDGVE